MVSSISSVNFCSQQYHNSTAKKKSNIAKDILIGGAVATTVGATIKGTKIIYPLLHKCLKYGVRATGVCMIGYGIYEAIKNKNSKSKEVELANKKDYAKVALAGAGVAAAYLPISQAISGSLISLKFSKGIKNFFSTFKLLLPQMKNYLLGIYSGLLGKVGIKQLGANKTILLGSLAVAGIGALAGAAIQGVTDLVSKHSSK